MTCLNTLLHAARDELLLADIRTRLTGTTLLIPGVAARFITMSTGGLLVDISLSRFAAVAAHRSKPDAKPLLSTYRRMHFAGLNCQQVVTAVVSTLARLTNEYMLMPVELRLELRQLWHAINVLERATAGVLHLVKNDRHPHFAGPDFQLRYALPPGSEELDMAIRLVQRATRQLPATLGTALAANQTANAVEVVLAAPRLVEFFSHTLRGPTIDMVLP
jgi:hypothetical protein